MRREMERKHPLANGSFIATTTSERKCYDTMLTFFTFLSFFTLCFMLVVSVIYFVCIFYLQAFSRCICVFVMDCCKEVVRLAGCWSTCWKRDFMVKYSQENHVDSFFFLLLSLNFVLPEFNSQFFLSYIYI